MLKKFKKNESTEEKGQEVIDIEYILANQTKGQSQLSAQQQNIKQKQQKQDQDANKLDNNFEEFEKQLQEIYEKNPYGNQQIVNKNQKKIIPGKEMPDNIYQYGVPMQNTQKQIQNNSDQDNDQLIQGIPIQNINEQQQILRQIMENSDNNSNNIIQNNNNNQQNMLTNQIIVNPNNGQILITHLERNRNININYGRVYVNEGYHIKKRRQFHFFSAIKYLDKIAMRLHDNFNYILKDISLNYNLNFRNDAQESIESFINNKIIQHNQISQYEQEKLNDTNFIWTCRHQITKIQTFFKCILNVLFILNIVQWSLIIARHAFQDHFEQQSEENGMQSLKWNIALSYVMAILWTFNNVCIFIAYINCRYKIFGIIAFFFLISFFLTIIIFGLSFQVAQNQNKGFFIMSLLQFLVFEVFSIILLVQTLQIKFQIVKLLVLSKELPYEALLR